MLGPSGSGKSTLLRCINLLEPPEERPDPARGQARSPAQERDATGVDFVRQRVGMVFQQFNLFPHKSALDNVRLAQEKVLDRSSEEASEKARGAARAGRARRQGRTSTPTGSPAASSSASRSPGRWRWTRT